MKKRGTVSVWSCILPLLYFDRAFSTELSEKPPHWVAVGPEVHETINVTITQDRLPFHCHNRIKRSGPFTVYECKRESCEDGVCRPEIYNGPHPPDWCRKGTPHKQQTKCSWSKSCSNWQPCEIQSTSCNHQYEDLTGSGRKSTFNFECFQRHNTCYIRECQGIDKCQPKVTMTMTRFMDEFVNKLPNCNDVDRRRGKRRGKRGAPPSVRALRGYCCEIAERWKGVKIATVRPIE